MSFNEYLSLLRRFQNEDDTLPAQEVSDQLTLFYTLAPSEMLEISREFHRKLLDTFKNRSDPNCMVLRGNLAARLAVVDSQYAASLAQEFKEYKKAAPDMRSAVAIAYAKSTNDIDGLISAYRRSTSDEDKIIILGAMTVFADENLIAKALDFALSGNVKRQDVVAVVTGAAQNPHVRGLMWVWLKSNIGKLQGLYAGTGLMSSIFASTIPLVCLGRVSEAEAFFGEQTVPGAEIGTRVGLEKLQAYDRLMNEVKRRQASAH
jgi:tricorn protease interacting factor F2/3